jgi:hypothetical protein
MTGIEQTRDAGTKAVVLALLFVFAFQCLRVYVLSEAGARYICPYTEVWLSDAAGLPGESGQAGSVRVTVAETSPTGSEIWGCPGGIAGMATAPAQPFGLPVAIAVVKPQLLWAAPEVPTPTALRPFLASVFRPPRNA